MVKLYQMKFMKLILQVKIKKRIKLKIFQTKILEILQLLLNSIKKG